MEKFLWTAALDEVTISDVQIVGGKNASLGEMIRNLKSRGIRVPGGFATTASAFRQFLNHNDLELPLQALLATLDLINFSNLNEISAAARKLILQSDFPVEFKKELVKRYQELCRQVGNHVSVAVRSSATAEDLPTASFAGQHDSFLNISGEEALLEAVKKCFASLYNARAIKYRIDKGFKHDRVLLSAGVQFMVRSDLGASGICFTIDPDSGFRDLIVINACWGLGENIVRGEIVPDEYHVFKPFLEKVSRPVLMKKIGSKSKTMVYGERGTLNVDTPLEKQKMLVLNDEELRQMAIWAKVIESHYKMPMDIEWAKDGISNEIFIIQARPETVHATTDSFLLKEFVMTGKGKALVSGNAVGAGISSGRARRIDHPSEADKLLPGEILVTEITNPDWDPIMKKAAGIITEKGGRTSHAAIVARELGRLAIVGATDANRLIKEGEWLTIDNSQGKTGTVYAGAIPFTILEHDFKKMKMPFTRPMLILADPEKAYKYSFYPNAGVGLMRMEFIITNSIKVHPMALLHFDELKDAEAKKEISILTEMYSDKREYFVDKLSEAVGTIASAFYPKEVIVRMSDLKSNEYAGLIGGKQFEPEEENPMIGFRGASRYYHENYRDGFLLECEAMKRVRDEMGFHNVKIMIPFCRTLEEGKKVMELLATKGLKRGENGLEVYVMAEIPSNVISAEAFAEIFDGFSIGSNDLTQLTLGIDRDSSIISDLFDENDPAVKNMIQTVIAKAKKTGAKIGLCGQAPSDDPAFAKFLIQAGIDSISFNPDALLKGIENMLAAEKKRNMAFEY